MDNLDEQEFKPELRYEDFLTIRSPNTRKVYLKAIRDFIKTVGATNEEEALSILRMKNDATNYMIKYILQLRSRNYTPKSIRLHITAIRGWLDFYELKYNSIKLKTALPKKIAVKETKALKKHMVKLLINLLHPSKKLACWTMFACGLRINEALKLRVKDLDLTSDPPRVYIRGGKTPSARRVVFIPRDLAEQLKEYVKDKKPEWPLFHSEASPMKPMSDTRFRTAFYGAARRLGILEPDPSGKGWTLSPHSLRRSYETILKNAGMNRDVLARLMGHVVSDVDMSYYKPTEDELANEWRKYEQYLMLEREEPYLEKLRDEYEQKIKQLEEKLKKFEEKYVVSELVELYAIEELLLKRRMFHGGLTDEETSYLEEVRDRIETLKKRFNRFELAKIQTLSHLIADDLKNRLRKRV